MWVSSKELHALKSDRARLSALVSTLADDDTAGDAAFESAKKIATLLVNIESERCPCAFCRLIRSARARA